MAAPDNKRPNQHPSTDDAKLLWNELKEETKRVVAGIAKGETFLSAVYGNIAEPDHFRVIYARAGQEPREALVRYDPKLFQVIIRFSGMFDSSAQRLTIQSNEFGELRFVSTESHRSGLLGIW